MSEPSPPPERPPIKKLTCLPPKLKTREEKNVYVEWPYRKRSPWK